MATQVDACIRGGHKRYGRKARIMEDFNMTVPTGTTYVLLGGSGSGKTTILKCLVGLKRLDRGRIYVLGGTPGTQGSRVPGPALGYMPQEEALCPQLTVRESLWFGGKLVGMRRRRLKERIEALAQLLHLYQLGSERPGPLLDRTVKNLSGGEKRRLSLGLALLHEPRLLVLDEPTVGVDPLLRQKIWEYLGAYVESTKSTVVMTTHYFEEALKADFVGMLAGGGGGKLLGEGPPRRMLARTSTTSLQELYLLVSTSEEPPRPPSGPRRLAFEPDSSNVIPDDPPVTECPCLPFLRGTCGTFASDKLKALLVKNFLQLLRNPGLLIFLILLPVLQVVLFCVAVGRDPRDLRLLVVNEEAGWPCAAPLPASCPTSNISCLFLTLLRSSRVVYCEGVVSGGRVEGEKEVKEGLAWGLVRLPRDFSLALVARALAGFSTPASILDAGTITARLDMSNMELGVAIAEALLDSTESAVLQLREGCSRRFRVDPGFLPFELGEPLFGKTKPNFMESAAPGVSLVIVFFLSMAMTSLLIIVEKNHGLLERTYTAGVKKSVILSSYVVCQLCVISLQAWLTLGILLFAFRVACAGSAALLFVLTLAQGICGMCFGMLISALCSKEVTAIQVSVGVFYPLMLLSGIIWPLEGMPSGMDALASALPLTLSVKAGRDICMRGWGLGHPTVLQGLLTPTLWSVMFLLGTAIALNYKR